MKNYQYVRLGRLESISGFPFYYNMILVCVKNRHINDKDIFFWEEVYEMVNVFHVAKYVLNKCGAMTPMKLEKLVYYCQAWSLAWDEVPLFNEEFEAWANGPVCPELFHKHKGIFMIPENFFCDVPEYTFSDVQIETMDAVIQYYGNKDPQWLSELAHRENPWKEARKGIPNEMPCNKAIDKENMLQYYGGLI